MHIESVREEKKKETLYKHQKRKKNFSVGIQPVNGLTVKFSVQKTILWMVTARTVWLGGFPQVHIPAQPQEPTNIKEFTEKIHCTKAWRVSKWALKPRHMDGTQ